MSRIEEFNRCGTRLSNFKCWMEAGILSRGAFRRELDKLGLLVKVDFGIKTSFTYSEEKGFLWSKFTMYGKNIPEWKARKILEWLKDIEDE